MSRLWIGIAAAFLVLLAALYYIIFVADDVGPAKGGTPTAEPAAIPLESAAITYYASGDINIRDAATINGSKIVGKLQRGEQIGGALVDGIAADEQWLKLDDGRGFVNIVNLSPQEMPVLVRNLGLTQFTLAAPTELWDAPTTEAQLIDRLSPGLTVTVAGITQNGFAEIILKKGGVGYIADGQKAIDDSKNAAAGPTIAIKIDPNGCAAGPEIRALFDRISARQVARRKAIEGADYASDEARDAAITKFEEDLGNKSEFLKINRSFKGLRITGVAQHYESQSVYFADSAEKVRETFRSLGVKIGKDGQIASREFYARIEATSNTDRPFGATDLNCGI